MHRILDRAHPVARHAAVVARDQHRPLGERHEYRIVHFQLDRQLDLFRAGIEPRRLDAGLIDEASYDEAEAELLARLNAIAQWQEAR